MAPLGSRAHLALDMRRNRVLRDRMKTALLLVVSLQLYLTSGAADKSQQATRCKTDYDVCVIGAGGSGAYTAAQLKKMGRSVLVLEKSQKVSVTTVAFVTRLRAGRQSRRQSRGPTD